MKQYTSNVLWDRFKETGKVSDYLEYRQSNVVKEQGDEDNEQSQRNYGQRNDIVSYVGR